MYYDISTYSVSSDLVSDSSTELQCMFTFSLCAARVYNHHMYIHATCKHHVEKGLSQSLCNVTNMHIVQYYYLSILIREYVMHPNTSLSSVNEHC